MRSRHGTPGTKTKSGSVTYPGCGGVDVSRLISTSHSVHRMVEGSDGLPLFVSDLCFFVLRIALLMIPRGSILFLYTFFRQVRWPVTTGTDRFKLDWYGEIEVEEGGACWIETGILFL